ncbi:ferrous iron transport protein A [bacterium]|nr:ferrous iron transport protein A [bacterium]
MPKSGFRNHGCRRGPGTVSGRGHGCKRHLQLDVELPLAEAGCGRRLQVCRVDGSRGVCGRLASLGIFPGQEVELVCAADSSRCLVRLNGSTVSLGDGAAEKILVKAA